jgi:hypothetical protein
MSFSFSHNVIVYQTLPFQFPVALCFLQLACCSSAMICPLNLKKGTSFKYEFNSILVMETIIGFYLCSRAGRSGQQWDCVASLRGTKQSHPVWLLFYLLPFVGTVCKTALTIMVIRVVWIFRFRFLLFIYHNYFCSFYCVK